MRTLPPPAANRVPEAQPAPICMPIPKANAPRAMETLTGATAPPTLPWARIGANSTMAAAIISSWAVTPVMSLSVRARRQAPVKPKAA